MRLFRTPFWVRWLFSQYEWKVQTQEKAIFLTFDDGPIPNLTEFVLEELAKYNAKATFFCVGDNIRKYTSIFQRIIQEGHQVGNHTYNHLNGWKNDNSTYWQNIEKCQCLIAQNTPLLIQKPLFRPPYGKITKTQAQQILLNYRIIMWDVLTYDFDTALSSNKCLQKAIQYTQKGSIVVFHDNLKAEKNLKFALPYYLEHFTAKGFQFKVL
ncbi:MAG: polysaccharide deacetylase family protein [Microscillaceae bacterium]|nr:polysaccharide deacetylase family protein [Microscillaceae bacterium]MDW8461449.1 polysaccharide deacetylase family protein [Cytophagales bacterium]